MKIRNGFVSNSSSSSFVMYGVFSETPTGEALLNLVKKTEKKKRKKNDDDDYDYEIFEQRMEKIRGLVGDLNVVTFGEGCEFWVGSDPCCMDEDMTMKQFKESVVQGLSKVSGVDVEMVTKDCEFHCQEADY